MEYLVELDGPVLGFQVNDKEIDCLCGKKLLKIEKNTGKIRYEREIFQKEGLARVLQADEKHIVVSDFCTLHIFDSNTFETVGSWKLGADLSSDICGLAMDGTNIYCSIRNGCLIVVDRISFEQMEYKITESSMWSLMPYGDDLICGTVAGQLLLLNKDCMSVKRKLKLAKQNIRSLYVDEQYLYAVSQDKRLFLIDLETFEVMNFIKNAHKKMFDCAGRSGEYIVTVSYPCGEIVFWDRLELKKCGQILTPLKLSGCTYVNDGQMLITSRNLQGIGKIDLSL